MRLDWSKFASVEPHKENPYQKRAQLKNFNLLHVFDSNFFLEGVGRSTTVQNGAVVMCSYVENKLCDSDCSKLFKNQQQQKITFCRYPESP